MKLTYEFLRFGEVIEPRKGYIFLDLGNRMEPGVIDHHFGEFEGSNFECSSSLIVKDPELVTSWISDEDLADEIKIVVHQEPDFDCIVSSFLTLRLLEAKENGKSLPEGWKEWAPRLAEAARRVDQGKTRLILPEGETPAPVTPYLAMILLSERSSISGLRGKEAWKWEVQEGLRIIEEALPLAPEGADSEFERIDLRHKTSGMKETAQLVDHRMAAFERDLTRIGLREGMVARGPQDGIKPIDLLDREDPALVHSAKIAFIRDPESNPGFFKSLIRGAFFDEVQATCVFITMPEEKSVGRAAWVRGVISVDPESRFSLRGLGRHLDSLETKERGHLGLTRVGPLRPGYDNSDPWFDGRSFGYTIVDSPRWGTVLPPASVQKEVLDSHAWHLFRMKDIVEGNTATLYSPALPPQHQRSALQELCAILPFLCRGNSSDQVDLTKKVVDALSLHLSSDCLDALTGAMAEISDPTILLLFLESRLPEVRAAAMSRLSDADISERACALAQESEMSHLLPPLRWLMQVKANSGELCGEVQIANLRRDKLLCRSWIDAQAGLAALPADRIARAESTLAEVLSAGFAMPELRSCALRATYFLGNEGMQNLADAAVQSVIHELKSSESLDEFAQRWPAWEALLREACRQESGARAVRDALEAKESASELPLHVRTALSIARSWAAGDTDSPDENGCWPTLLDPRLQSTGEAKEITAWVNALRAVATGQAPLNGEMVTEANRHIQGMWDRWISDGRLLECLFLLRTLASRERLFNESDWDRTLGGLPAEEMLKIGEAIRAEYTHLMSRCLHQLITVLHGLFPGPGDRPRDGIISLLDDVFESLKETLGYDAAISFFAKDNGLRFLSFDLQGEILSRMLRLDSMPASVVMTLFSLTMVPWGREVVARSHEMRSRGEKPHLKKYLLHLAQVSAILSNRRAEMECPGYMVPALLQLGLPILMATKQDNSDKELFQEAYTCAVHVLCEHPEARGTNGRSEEMMRLGELVRSELYYHLPNYTALFQHLAQALAHAEMLLRSRALLTQADDVSSGFARELIDWSLALPYSDDRESVAKLISFRHDLSPSNLENISRGIESSVDWACGCLEDILPAFEGPEAVGMPRSPAIRAALRAFRTGLQNLPEGGMVRLLHEALKGAEIYISKKLLMQEALEKALASTGLKEKDDLASDILEVSTFDWIRSQMPEATVGANTDALVTAQATIIAQCDTGKASAESKPHGSDRESNRERILSHVRFEIGKDVSGKKRWKAILKILGHDREGSNGAVLGAADRLYSRLGYMFHLDPLLIDRVFSQLTETMISRYELSWAQKRIEQYSLTPLGITLRFWLSGGIILIPILFMSVFWLESWERYQSWAHWDLEILLVLTLGFGTVALTRLTQKRSSLQRGLKRRMKGLAKGLKSPGNRFFEDRAKMMEGLKLKLFLPQYVVPVIIGVYTVSLTDEVALKIGNVIDGGRLALLLVGFIMASFWAIKELIKKEGGDATLRNALIATGKIFSYSFFVAMVVNLVVAPLIKEGAKEASHPLALGWHLSVPTEHFADLFSIYPRHLLLYATLGMFVGIFLHGILRVKEE